MNSWERVGRRRYRSIEQGDAAYEPEKRRSTGLVMAGYVLAIAIPLIGFIIGIVLMTRRHGAHGVAVMVLSIVACFVWIAVLFAAAGA